MPIKRLNLPALTGGLNEKSRPDIIEDSQLTECLNYEFDGAGVLKKRTDPELFDRPQTVGDFVIYSGLNHWIEYYNRTIRYISEPLYFTKKSSELFGDYAFLTISEGHRGAVETSLEDSGTGYSLNSIYGTSYRNQTSNDNGIGLTIKVTELDGSAIDGEDGYEIVDPGLNYKVGDLLDIGDGGAYLAVTKVFMGGVVDMWFKVRISSDIDVSLGAQEWQPETVNHEVLSAAGINLNNIKIEEFSTHISDDKIIITDGVHPVWCMTRTFQFDVNVRGGVDEDGNWFWEMAPKQNAFMPQVYGNHAPLLKPEVVSPIGESYTEDDRWKSEYWENDEYGSRVSSPGIVQCSYTVVDSKGNETNPSPVSNSADFQWFSLDEDGVNGRWINRIEVRNLGLPSGIHLIMAKKLFKYFNIYFRVSQNLEGVSGNLEFCQRVSIKNYSQTHDGEEEVVTQSFNEEFNTGNNYTVIQEIESGNIASYENDIAPISDVGATNGGITLVGNAMSNAMKFPWQFYAFKKWEFANATSSTDAIIRVNIDFGESENIEDGNLNWTRFFEHSTVENTLRVIPEFSHQIRFYDQDMTTPLKTMLWGAQNEVVGEIERRFLFYIKIPQLTEHYTLYLVYTPEKEFNGIEIETGAFGGVNDYFNGNTLDIDGGEVPTRLAIGYDHGRFYTQAEEDISIVDKMFKPTGIVSLTHKICCPMEEPWLPETSEPVPNKADFSFGLQDGSGIIHQDGETTLKFGSQPAAMFPRRDGDLGFKPFHIGKTGLKWVHDDNSFSESDVNFGNIHGNLEDSFTAWGWHRFKPMLTGETSTIEDPAMSVLLGNYAAGYTEAEHSNNYLSGGWSFGLLRRMTADRDQRIWQPALLLGAQDFTVGQNILPDAGETTLWVPHEDHRIIDDLETVAGNYLYLKKLNLFWFLSVSPKTRELTCYTRLMCDNTETPFVGELQQWFPFLQTVEADGQEIPTIQDNFSFPQHYITDDSILEDATQGQDTQRMTMLHPKTLSIGGALRIGGGVSLLDEVSFQNVFGGENYHIYDDGSPTDNEDGGLVYETDLLYPDVYGSGLTIHPTSLNADAGIVEWNIVDAGVDYRVGEKVKVPHISGDLDEVPYTEEGEECRFRVAEIDEETGAVISIRAKQEYLKSDVNENDGDSHNWDDLKMYGWSGNNITDGVNYIASRYINDKNIVAAIGKFQNQYESYVGAKYFDTAGEGRREEATGNISPVISGSIDETFRGGGDIIGSPGGGYSGILGDGDTNLLRWTDIYGISFPDLWFKKMKEPVLRIVPAPSFLQLKYANTFLVFTRNTISRFVLEGSASSWGGSTESLIEEHEKYGLYAPQSLVRCGSSLVWLSEAGVVMWNSDGISLISKDVVDIPITLLPINLASLGENIVGGRRTREGGEVEDGSFQDFGLGYRAGDTHDTEIVHKAVHTLQISQGNYVNQNYTITVGDILATSNPNNIDGTGCKVQVLAVVAGHGPGMQEITQVRVVDGGSGYNRFDELRLEPEHFGLDVIRVEVSSTIGNTNTAYGHDFRINILEVSDLDGSITDEGLGNSWSIADSGEEYETEDILKIIPLDSEQENDVAFQIAYLEIEESTPPEDDEDEEDPPEDDPPVEEDDDETVVEEFDGYGRGRPISEYRAVFQPIRNQYILTRDWWSRCWGLVDYGNGFVYASTNINDDRAIELVFPAGLSNDEPLVVGWNYNDLGDPNIDTSMFDIDLSIEDVIRIEDEDIKIISINKIIEEDGHSSVLHWHLGVERGQNGTTVRAHATGQRLNRREDSSWVYHLDVGSWTKMDGLVLENAITLSGGQDIHNVNLFLTKGGTEIHQYPGNTYTSKRATIKTKEFYLEKGVLHKLRADYEKGGSPIEARTYLKNRDVDDSTSVIEDYAYVERGLSLSVLDGIEDNEWRGVPQGRSRGRSAQIRISDADKIKSIQMKFKTKGGGE